MDNSLDNSAGYGCRIKIFKAEKISQSSDDALLNAIKF